MLRSMTAYAHKEFKTGWGKIIVEIKSLNHRFLDTVYHFPQGFLFLEETVSGRIRSALSRGRINYYLSFSPGPKENVVIRKDLIKSYLKQMKSLSKMGIESFTDAQSILHLPGVLSLEIDDVFKKRVKKEVGRLTEAALRELIGKKTKEGTNTRRDIEHMLSKMVLLVNAIFKKTKISVKKYRNIITDNDRFSEKLNAIDVHEEIQRLSFHIKNTKQTLRRKVFLSGTGKELSFVTQEMQREINTLGAKCVDKQISLKVIKVKSLIEKIREQLQNVE
ncbi:MAG: YicC/YloC family endoribonuclease [Candidatus Gygaella obscura]|nr:YicC/YloC family endoribonuclease [Candidatus Gygaella obscura]